MNWNQYSDEEKRAVLSRIDQLTQQIMAERFMILSVEKLMQALDDFRFFYDPTMSPYCWLHNLLQKRLYRINSLDEVGASLAPSHNGREVSEVIAEINQELFTLSLAHYERYFESRFSRGTGR